MLRMKNNPIQLFKKHFSKKWCDNLSSYAEIVCKQKATTIDETDTTSRRVFNYALGNSKQDSLYKSFLYRKISEIIKNYCQNFFFLNDIEILNTELLKYEAGNFYKPHIDDSAQTPRTLSLIINLNDDYVGGELFFMDEKNENAKNIFELKKGDAIIFPSNFLYPHGIFPIISGKRYSVITWLR